MKAVIFDLDGTLINSLKDIALSTNDVLKEFGFKIHPLEDYNYFVGDGALVLIQNALPKEVSKEIIKKVLQRFKEVYEFNVHQNTHAYEGIIQLLKDLETHHVKKAILSNKPHKFTLKYVESLFSQFHFEEIHGQKEDVPKKPDPSSAKSMAQNMNLECHEIFYVGDTSTDINTAKNSGMKSIGVTWGFRPRSELEEAGADYIVEQPAQILNLILDLRS